MELTWYGTAALVLREGDTAIAFDPFDGLPMDRPSPETPLPHEEALRDVDGVFVTHGHFDHIYHIPRLYAGRDIPVHCTAAPAATLRRKGLPEGQIVPIGPGWRGQVGPFTVTAWRGKHCRFDLPVLIRALFGRVLGCRVSKVLQLLRLRVQFRENWEILFYEVECKGRRVQIMGSMSLQREGDYPAGADLLVLPLQGRSDQDVYALKLVERLRPKAVLLDHWDNSFPPLTEEVEVGGFIRNVTERFAIPCERREKGAALVLNGK